MPDELPSPPSSQPQIKLPSILLIDDDELFRDALAKVLIGWGFSVTQAADGVQGVKLFSAEPTDLVLTELVLPNQDGITTVKELRRAHPEVGIIAMSGKLAVDPDLYLKIAAAFGANRTLKKPFDLSALQTAIEDVLAESGETSPPRNRP